MIDRRKEAPVIPAPSPRTLAALVLLLSSLSPVVTLADQVVSTDSGGTVTLGSDFVISNATLADPAGTLSLSCQVTSIGPAYPFAAEWSCSGGSYTLVSSDSLTSVQGVFSSGLLTEEITGGGHGNPRFYWYAFTGNFSGTMTRNGVQQPITGATVQTLAELHAPLGTGAIASGADAANSVFGPFYVADTYNDRIVHVDDMLGDNWTSYGVAGSGPGQFQQPWGIAVDAAGRIYTVDSGNNRVVRIDDLSGDNWTEIGTLGSGVKQFNYPHGIWVDASGRIYVCDGENGRIVRMDDMSGTNWTTYGSVGSGAGQFTQPTGITLDATGRIYVADAMNNRLVRIDDMTGANWTALGSNGNGVGQFSAPSGVWIDTAGLIYVADMANDRITRMSDMLGTGWSVLGGVLGTGVDQFINPYSVCVDSSSTIYVADSQSGRIARADEMSGLGWTSYGTEGTGQNNFMVPMGIIVGRRMAVPASVVSATPLPGNATRFAPNPFSNSTEIAYEVPVGGGEVGLQIFDTSGRLVRILRDGGSPAGMSKVVWDGRDDQGRKSQPGIYFFRLRVRDRISAGRVILTR